MYNVDMGLVKDQYVRFLWIWQVLPQGWGSQGGQCLLLVLSVTVDSVCKYQCLGMTSQYVQGPATTGFSSRMSRSCHGYLQRHIKTNNFYPCDIHNSMLRFQVAVYWYHFSGELTTHLRPTFLYVCSCVCSFFIPSPHQSHQMWSLSGQGN